MDNTTNAYLANVTGFANVTDFANVTANFTEAFNATTDGSLVNVTEAPARPRPAPLQPGYYHETTQTLWKVVPPIIMAWGLTGNFLTVMVLFRQMMKKMTSTALYLMALAFSDSVILLCGPLRNFIKNMWKKDVRNFTDAGCRIQLYVTYASVHLSSWLLVAVTMERVLSVTLPHKVKLGCTPMVAMGVIVAIFISVFGLNIAVPVINGEKPFVRSFNCAPTTPEYQKFRDDIWQWIDFLVAFAVPFLFLLVGNVVIIVHLYKSVQRKKQMSSSAVSTAKTRSISILLVLLCFVFITTMAPVSIFQIYYPYRYEEIMNLPTYKEAFYAYYYLIFEHAVVNLVGYTNASFNFLMYVLSGSKFRNDLLQMLCICKKQKTFKGMIVTSQTKQTSAGKTSSISDNRSSRTTTHTSKVSDVGRTTSSVKYIVEPPKENGNHGGEENGCATNGVNTDGFNEKAVDVEAEETTGKVNGHHDNCGVENAAFKKEMTESDIKTLQQNDAIYT